LVIISSLSQCLLLLILLQLNDFMSEFINGLSKRLFVLTFVINNTNNEL